VASPLPESLGEDIGELRLQSDFELARDERTACFWQSMINQEALMAARFKSAMAKMAIIGHRASDLIDCSAVVPIPVPALNKPGILQQRASLISNNRALNHSPVLLPTRVQRKRQSPTAPTTKLAVIVEPLVLVLQVVHNDCACCFDLPLAAHISKAFHFQYSKENIDWVLAFTYMLAAQKLSIF